MKKIIIFCITLMGLILLTLFSIFFIKNKELSKTEFIALMEKFENVSNVKLEGITTKYKKDNFMLVVETADIYSWSDLEKQEHIRYSPTLKQYTFINQNYIYNNSYDIRDLPYTFIRL